MQYMFTRLAYCNGSNMLLKAKLISPHRNIDLAGQNDTVTDDMKATPVDVAALLGITSLSFHSINDWHVVFSCGTLTGGLSPGLVVITFVAALLIHDEEVTG